MHAIAAAGSHRFHALFSVPTDPDDDGGDEQEAREDGAGREGGRRLCLGEVCGVVWSAVVVVVSIDRRWLVVVAAPLPLL